MISASSHWSLATGITCWLAATAIVYSHDRTLQQFLRARAIAQATTQRQAEPAPTEKERACRLTIELVTGDPPQPTPGLLRITNLSSGKAVSLADEIHRAHNWYAISSPVTLAVPRAKLKIEGFYGLETEMAIREINLTGKEALALRIPLTRFYSAAARGLKAGNTHLHLMKLTHAEMDRYLRLVPKADALDLVFVSLLRRIPDERDYISNTLTEGDLGRLARHGVLFGNGEEHRHNFGPGGEGYGHVMLLNILKLIEPVSIGPGIMKSGTDGIPLQRGIRTARNDGATVIWCHNTFGHEDIPNWLAGLLHAQNIFDGGDHGTYEDTFYRYLNLGINVPFSTGTDWFIYDFSRVYVPVSGELTAKKWLAELAAGRSYITNGVFLEFTADGNNIGETIAATGRREIQVLGRGLGRNDFQRLELIHNGRIVHSTPTRPEAGHFAAEVKFTLRVSEPGWLALRIPGGTGTTELGKPLFAHTSPIYIELEGQRLFSPGVARELLTEMQASMAAIEEKGTFADSAERQAVLGVYHQAMEILRRQLTAHP